MQPTIIRYILQYSKRQQIFLLLVTALSFPFLYFSLELPKRIINEAIGPESFVPRAFVELFGFQLLELDQLPYLFALCSLFLALVLVNGGFKYFINVYKGRLGERMLRRLRYELFGRALRFPLPHFRRTSQGEIISMITAEVEPLGGYVGDVLALPAFQGGTLITILVFLFAQNPILGGAAIALYPLQMYLIPKLQSKVNALGKQRIQAVRKTSERIGEVISGIQELHSNDTSELELADFSHRMGAIYVIRYEIYRLKFFIKFLNNFIAQVTPFFFFSIGGYLVIQGELTFGALVAVLNAYKDLSAPWKELLAHYQRKEDARIKYEQLIDQFHPPDMLDESLQRGHPDTVPPLDGAVIATNLTLEEEGGIKMLDGVSFRFDGGISIAVVGPGGGGGDGLVQVLARLLQPTGGSVRIGEHTLSSLPEAITGRRMAYVDQSVRLFSGTVRDNLYYSLKHRPVRDAEYDEAEGKERSAFIAEAEQSGNTTSDYNADWIDYDLAGVDGAQALRARTDDVLTMVGLRPDIYAMGLQGTVDPTARPDLVSKVLEARGALRQRLEDPEIGRLVEPFDLDSYNVNMSVAENLLFGTPIGDRFDYDHLAQNPYMRSVLEKVGLDEAFLVAGLRLANIMVELFADLPPDHEYFERYSFIGADELPDYQQLVRRADSGGSSGLTDDERSQLMSLPFKLVTGRHRLGVIDEGIRKQILVARKMFAESIPEELRGSIAFFDSADYNPAASIQDNILFGKVVYGRRDAAQRVTDLIRDVVKTMDLEQDILEVGLESQVGVGGSRMSVAQAQKIGIARCLLKKPDLMIVNDAVAALDPATQTQIMECLFKEFDGRGLVWLLGRPDQAERFQHALVMESGKVAEQGSVQELNTPGKRLHAMINGE